MPPIKLHKDAPISAAAKAEGITPQTADPQAAQNPPPTRTKPASVPATTTQSASNPPAPQPGARPVAPTASTNNAPSSGDAGPPPPQPGYTATHTTTETRLGGPPPQYSIPPPVANNLPTHSTTSSTTPSKSGPTSLNLGPAAPAASPYQHEHTGGAIEGRSSLEGPPGYTQAPDNTPYGGGFGGGGVSGGGGDSAVQSEGVAGQAWSILAKAGEALKKGEEAAWKAVRK